MIKLSDTLVSTDYLAKFSMQHPVLGHDRMLVAGLDELQGKLDLLQKGVIEADKITQIIKIVYAVTADATGGLAIFEANAPFAFEIIDVRVQARATSGGGTLKLTDGTNDITDTIACATDTNIDMADTIDDTYSTIAANGTLKVVANGAADRGLVTVYVIPR